MTSVRAWPRTLVREPITVDAFVASSGPRSACRLRGEFRVGVEISVTEPEPRVVAERFPRPVDGQQGSTSGQRCGQRPRQARAKPPHQFLGRLRAAGVGGPERVYPEAGQVVRFQRLAGCRVRRLPRAPTGTGRPTRRWWAPDRPPAPARTWPAATRRRSGRRWRSCRRRGGRWRRCAR